MWGGVKIYSAGVLTGLGRQVVLLRKWWLSHMAQENSVFFLCIHRPWAFNPLSLTTFLPPTKVSSTVPGTLVSCQNYLLSWYTKYRTVDTVFHSFPSSLPLLHRLTTVLRPVSLPTVLPGSFINREWQRHTNISQRPGMLWRQGQTHLHLSPSEISNSYLFWLLQYLKLWFLPQGQWLFCSPFSILHGNPLSLAAFPS